MKKISCLLAAVAVFFITSISEGTEWEYFMQNSKGDNYYLDLASLKNSGEGTVRITRKIEPGESSDISYLIDDMEMDCRGSRVRLLKQTAYDKGSDERVMKGPGHWQSAGTNDIDELMLELVCSLKKTSK